MTSAEETRWVKAALLASVVFFAVFEIIRVNHEESFLSTTATLLATPTPLPVQHVPRPPRYFVVFSVDCCDQELYALFAPFTALIWHQMGFIPLVIIAVNRITDLESPRGTVLVEAIQQARGLVFPVVTPSGVPKATTAQIARLVISLSHELANHDMLMTSDSDMWPLSKSYFDVNKIPQDHMGILYANAYSDGDQMLAICYLMASVKTWRQLVQPIVGYEFGTAVYRAIETAQQLILPDQWNQPGGGSPQNLNQWYADQKLAYQWIKKSPIPLFLVNRDTSTDRLDRSNWDGRTEGRIDAHLLRPWNRATRDLFLNLMRWKSMPEFISHFIAEWTPHSLKIEMPINHKAVYVQAQSDIEKEYWPRLQRGGWEPSTFKVLNRLINNQTTVYDIGAWMGPISLYAATQGARQVFSFEPDRNAVAILRHNVELNSHYPIQVEHRCISTKPERVAMELETGGSGARIVRNQGEGTVECVVLLPWVEAYPAPHFIKVDTEGGERELLPSWKEWVPTIKPHIFVSMHRQLVQYTDEEVVKVKSFINLFPVVYLVNECLTCQATFQPMSLPLDTLCKECDYLLTWQPLNF